MGEQRGSSRRRCTGIVGVYAAVQGTVWWGYAVVLGSVRWGNAAVLGNRTVGEHGDAWRYWGVPLTPLTTQGERRGIPWPR